MLVGAAALLLLAGASDRPTAVAWQRRVGRWAWASVLLAVGAGLAALGHQAAVVSDRPSAAFERAALTAVLLDTQAGRLWLARHGLLVLVAAFVWLAPRAAFAVDRPARLPGARLDWLAVRGELVLLAALALALVAATGHAAAVTPDARGPIAVDALHLLATGVWIGGLVPLGALLATAARDGGADARPYAVLTARRFSRVALGCVAVLVASGLVNALVQVGGIPALVGTTYGRLLLLKLGLLVPLVVLGAVNRRTLIPRLAGEAVAVGRPAMRRLAASVGVEAALAAAVVAVVATMSVTPPGRHADPTWPFSFRLTFAALDTPAVRARVLVGSQVLVLGVVGAVCAVVARRRRLPFALGSAAVAAFGAGLMLPPLAVDAYPTTYRRPAVTYQASSIAEGQSLFRTYCAPCHGSAGAGDGPFRPSLPRAPADLRAAHTRQHTAGDIFWWVTAGIPGAGMPPFGRALGDEQRWDLVNFVRALGSGAAARRFGDGLARPELVAPDFTFAVGPTPPRALRDYRGRRVVLLVLYTLPASRERLVALAQAYDALVLARAEIIAVPHDASADAIRRLGDTPRILFPVVTDGARDIVTAYDLFASGPHAEFLVDRQGYLRGRWTAPRPVDAILADVASLNAEPAAAAPADEHAH